MIESVQAGQKEPKVETLVRLAGAMGVGPATLLKGIRWKPGFFGPGSFVFEEEDA
jgi:hypothetical protein